MFVSAIEAVEKFTRPIHTVIRQSKSDRLTPSVSTLFFVNDHGDAVTCGHIMR